MKAFVTGSTGLVGSNLVKMLVAQGYQVKALARSAEKARRLFNDPRIEIVIGDMEDIPGFAPHLAGVDVLFHTAAYFREYFSSGEHWTKLMQINVHGTIRLLDEAERNGVQKTVYVSSSGVIGRRKDGGESDETTPPDEVAERDNLYFKSKVLAEQAIADWLRTHRMPVVLVLPGAIIGPGDTGPTTLGQGVISVIKGALPMVPPGGFEFVDARDVAQAMINAVTSGRSGERYLLSAGWYSMADFSRAIASAAGVAAPGRVAPYWMLVIGARFMELSARITGRDPLITMAALRSMRHKIPLDVSKARRELGITFRPFEESLRDEVEWFRANGYVAEPKPEAVRTVSA